MAGVTKKPKAAGKGGRPPSGKATSKDFPSGIARRTSPLRFALFAAIALLAVVLLQYLLTTRLPDADGTHPQGQTPPQRRRAEGTAGKSSDMDSADGASDAGKYRSDEWVRLDRDLNACVAAQHDMMTVPVAWPGFHALCLDSISDSAITVLLHSRSGALGEEGTRELKATASTGATTGQPAVLLTGLVLALQQELKSKEFDRRIDSMISTSDYDFIPNPWRLFSSAGGPIEVDADLRFLGEGAAVYLYTGGQFIWPGVRLGHKTEVPIPVTDGSEGDHKIVEMETVSLRPLVFVLSGFLTPEECNFIKSYAMARMEPSRLATMDSTVSEEDVRTSTQTFMTRGGSAQIRALEERAHNLTRLPYENGENIQVVRYVEGQKYGAHRDFFNPNDYHKQPSMLRNVEYGARNRLATVFWYLESVEEGGETFFPRALNAEGREYNPWNGDHNDCYRGLYVKPVQGNAVLFYSIVPDGRLDERSLHGGCRPRHGGEKWGANQWIWNHPQRMGHFASAPPRRGAKPRTTSSKPGCADKNPNCEAWAESGECEHNAEYMRGACALSCGTC